MMDPICDNDTSPNNKYIADFILGYWGGLVIRIKFF